MAFLLSSKLRVSYKIIKLCVVLDTEFLQCQIKKTFFQATHSQKQMENVKTLCSSSHGFKRQESPVWPLSDPEDAQKQQGYARERV